jgi:hypothetical protein
VVVGGRRHGVDLRETFWRGVTFVGMAGCHVAKLGAEADLASMVEVLVAKEDDLPLVQRRTDAGHLIGRQRRGQVDSTDFGAGPTGQRRHL